MVAVDASRWISSHSTSNNFCVQECPTSWIYQWNRDTLSFLYILFIRNSVHWNLLISNRICSKQPTKTRKRDARGFPVFIENIYDKLTNSSVVTYFQGDINVLNKVPPVSGSDILWYACSTRKSLTCSYVNTGPDFHVFSTAHAHRMTTIWTRTLSGILPRGQI